MSTIANDIYSSLGLSGSSSSTSSTSSSDSLGQADFLRLMTTQLQYQDPLNPMENSAFLGQLAQFSTVQGIQELNTQVESFSSALSSDQILRGATLVGHTVLVPSAKLALAESGETSGVVAAPSAGTVQFQITDANGQKVRQISVTAERAGETAFSWDGTDDNGERLAAGSYTISAVHTDYSGNTTDLDTYVSAQVESVTIGSDGLYLNLPGLGTAPLDYVLRVS